MGPVFDILEELMINGSTRTNRRATRVRQIALARHPVKTCKSLPEPPCLAMKNYARVNSAHHPLTVIVARIFG